MADLTLAEAASRYAESVKESSRQLLLGELNRFVRWYGANRPLSDLRGHDVSLYADVLGPASPETIPRADCVRSFLTYLKKQGLVETNFGPHLRLHKSARAATSAAGEAQQSAVALSSAGLEAMRAELDQLLAQRAHLRDEIRLAMQDKDFRENAPLDAAKEKQGHHEARIREIQELLKRVVIVEEATDRGRVCVGSAVAVKNLGNGAVTRYRIVGPAEARAADGKISSESPVGRALLDCGVGDEVEVTVPAGVMRLKIEEIES